MIFFADAAKGNTTKHEPRGTVKDGRYTMLTHPRQGAPPGWYKVGVISTEPSDPKNPYSEPRSLIPEKFGKAEETKVPSRSQGRTAASYDLNSNNVKQTAACRK